MLIALTNGILYTGEEKLTGKVLLLKDGSIESVVDPRDIPSSAKVIDFQNHHIAPGFIDLQIYGSGGKLFGGKPTVDALEQMENDLLAQGCTGFLATSATNTPLIVHQAIDSAKAYRKKALGNFLGLHIEGPFLNPKSRGAHPEKFIRKATLNEVKEWVDRAEGEIKMMTIAPELQDNEVINYLDSQGIVISAGHSNATYEEGLKFLNNPVKAVTHLYNAMPKIHHRDPGLVAAVFKVKPYASIVADGIHVSYPMVELAKRELGEHLFLITDAVTETNEGVYPHVFKGDRYTMPDDTLSGSCLTMLKAVANCVKYAGIPLQEAINMASLYPASVLGKAGMIGKIKPGYKANLIVFNNDFNVQSIFFNGNLL